MSAGEEAGDSHTQKSEQKTQTCLCVGVCQLYHNIIIQEQEVHKKKKEKAKRSQCSGKTWVITTTYKLDYNWKNHCLLLVSSSMSEQGRAPRVIYGEDPHPSSTQHNQ